MTWETRGIGGVATRKLADKNKGSSSLSRVIRHIWNTDVTIKIKKIPRHVATYFFVFSQSRWLYSSTSCVLNHPLFVQTVNSQSTSKWKKKVNKKKKKFRRANNTHLNIKFRRAWWLSVFSFSVRWFLRNFKQLCSYVKTKSNPIAQPKPWNWNKKLLR